MIHGPILDPCVVSGFVFFPRLGVSIGICISLLSGYFLLTLLYITPQTLTLFFVCFVYSIFIPFLLHSDPFSTASFISI